MSGERREQPGQEISIKRRGHDLFIDETAPSTTGPSRPFSEFLRDTPAKPLSAGVKAALWAVSIVAAMLFAAALWRLVNRPTPKPSAPRKARTKSTTPKKTDADHSAPPPIARFSTLTDQEIL
ncbi:hypothetical protein [Paludisphaera rhizosphaerae]|uniref:hypothetical protein n=1 Tax=Paludisphaera rhizosphaerae TaxID=2711216 RepID=UPI0013ED5CB7|nr:hypothetical protein [Paludisphaera rhizosphaerae]